MEHHTRAPVLLKRTAFSAELHERQNSTLAVSAALLSPPLFMKDTLLLLLTKTRSNRISLFSGRACAAAGPGLSGGVRGAVWLWHGLWALDLEEALLPLS